MIFGELLNKYICLLGCTARQLADASGITPATISRYCNSKRIPSPDSTEIDNLALGISTLAASLPDNDFQDKDMSEKILSLRSYEHVKETLRASITPIYDPVQAIKKFNLLVDSINLNSSRLSKAIGYDTSYIYKIRSGERKPADMENFIKSVVDYTVINHNSLAELNIIASLIGSDAKALTDKRDRHSLLMNWLTDDTETSGKVTSINSFLENLEDFDLDEYIRTINFDKLKVPTVPVNIIHAKTYYDLDGMKEAELDFFKGTVLSKSKKPIFMCSNMPLEDMANDIEFGKKWMFAVALSIKKGLHIEMIHNLNRPFSELLLGLQSWIPLYMTGQISPYYFTGRSSSVFHQLTYVSGSCALDGQCVEGFHSDGKYTLYSSKSDVQYYRKRADALLASASPLMDIMSQDETDRLKSILESDIEKPGNYVSRLSSLPSHTLSKDLLNRILTRNGRADQLEKIWNDLEWNRSIIRRILKKGTLKEIVSIISKEEFERYTPTVSLGVSEKNNNIKYTYEEYLEHIRLTEDQYRSIPSYTFEKDTNAPFRNINIRSKEDSWALISKKKSPEIHFMIYHPKLVNAILNFIPVVEK